MNNKYQVLAGNAAGVSSPVQFTLAATPVQLTSLTAADASSSSNSATSTGSDPNLFVA